MSESANTFSRRTMLTALLAGAGGVTFAGSVSCITGGQGAPRGYLDVSSAEVRAAGNFLRLRIDNLATGTRSGEAVPLVLGTSQNETIAATVTSTTSRTVLAHAKDATGQAGPLTLQLSTSQQNPIWVTPREFGPPLAPGDTLKVTSPHGEMKIDVWIEPSGGKWSPEIFLTDTGATTPDMGIVAMHAALVRKANGSEVITWSPPRIRDTNGNPVPDPNRAGRYQWYKFRLNDVESRALNVTTRKTADRPLPAWPGAPRGENIFCGGAAHLPDGRILVAGGHETPDYSAKNNDNITDNANHIYIYDPSKGAWEKTSVEFIRVKDPIDPKNPPANPIRWYPTITTLPDGRMLVTSGTRHVLEGNENDASAAGYWASINNNYVIFDPGSRELHVPKDATLIDPEKLPSQTEVLATYPGVFVLPKGDNGAVIAVAETNRGWLYDYVPTEDAPLKRAGKYYPMKTPGSRSYPTYGSMVLLPVDPSRSTLRILAVGGQGGPNPDHRSLDAGQLSTPTAEIFQVDTTAPLTDPKQRWRDPQGSPAGMNRSRVLCDATLLADGTVLVSGGSETGWGDQNRGPVNDAEIFNPATETFTLAATADTDRRYHSTALLQLDGSVLKAGSSGGFGNVNGFDKDNNPGDTEKDNEPGGNGKPWMDEHTDAERYYPPYLWRGPRPLDHQPRPRHPQLRQRLRPHRIRCEPRRQGAGRADPPRLHHPRQRHGPAIRMADRQTQPQR